MSEETLFGEPKIKEFLTQRKGNRVGANEAGRDEGRGEAGGGVITRIDCACTLHMLEVEVEDDGVVFLSSWRLATPRHEYGALRQRLREAWRSLRGWDVAGDEYVLNPDDARKLAAALVASA